MSPESTSLRSAREDAIDALCRGFAEDALSMQELEHRLAKAREARTRSELDVLLGDLPGTVRTTSPVPPEVRAAARRASGRSADRPAPRASRPSEDDHIPASRHLAFAVMGGTRRAGRWSPPSSVLAMACMGSVELDFTAAEFTEPVVEVTCFALWGGVEVKVPPGVHVETHGFALLGGFDQVANGPQGKDGPTVRVNGFAIMGGVEVNVVDPDAEQSTTRGRDRGGHA